MSHAQTAKKLQSAINQRAGIKLLISTKQWYSEDRKRAVTVYIISQSLQDEITGKRKTIELFRTYSQVQMVLWLRDYWYTINGWEIPKTEATKKWEEVKCNGNAERAQS